MAGRLPPASSERPLRAVEVGAGIGTMVERLLDRGLLTHAVYDAVDRDPSALAAAPDRLHAWAASHGWAAKPVPQGVSLSRPDRQVDVRFHVADLDAFASVAPQGSVDLLLAHAVLDLIDAPRSLPRLLRLLRPPGVFYFTLVFDGLTAFLPAAAFDESLMEAYHRTMDERQPRSGGRHAGRELLVLLPQLGATIVDVGSSDWWVRPAHGSYPADEPYFLHYLVETVRGAVSGRPELAPGEVGAWAERRHAQIEAGQLMYLAHQWDVAGVWPAAKPEASIDDPEGQSYTARALPTGGRLEMLPDNDAERTPPPPLV